MGNSNLDKLRKDYKENKEEYDEMFKEITKSKYEKCTKIDKNGKKYFDYLKMSQMYHSGNW